MRARPVGRGPTPGPALVRRARCEPHRAHVDAPLDLVSISAQQSPCMPGWVHIWAKSNATRRKRFPHQRPSTCTSAASVSGSHKVIPISRYSAIAVDSAPRACSRWPVAAYSVPRPRWQCASSGACPAPQRGRGPVGKRLQPARRQAGAPAARSPPGAAGSRPHGLVPCVFERAQAHGSPLPGVLHQGDPLGAAAGPVVRRAQRPCEVGEQPGHLFSSGRDRGRAPAGPRRLRSRPDRA